MINASGSSKTVINNEIINDKSWNLWNEEDKYNLKLNLNNEKYLLKGLNLSHLNNILHTPDKNFNIQNVIKEYEPLYEKEIPKEKILKKRAKTYKISKKNKSSRRRRK
tara:strand:- start:381 stop:704 length:324 start_codon:yes stop_codon:yes gene_type:complete